MKPLLFVVSFLALAALGGVLVGEQERETPDVNAPCQGTKSAPVTYQVDLRGTVTAPPKTKVLRVWVPIPLSDATQDVSDSKFATFPATVAPTIATEKVHGNTFAYFEFARP